MKEILAAGPKEYQNNKMFDISNPIFNRDNCMEPNIELKKAFAKAGYDYKTFDLGDPEKAEYIIFSDIIHCAPLYEKCVQMGLQRKMILFIWEPPVVSRLDYDKEIHKNFRTIFTWMDDLVDGKKYKKFYWPQPSLPHQIRYVPFSERKLLTLISGNKTSTHPKELYSERMTAIEYFSSKVPYDFDFYGMGWEREINILVKIKEALSPSYYRCYRGTVKSKYDMLANYKFCVCYENMKDVRGYITEKIFDCFKSRTVPIYYGASNITDYIPKDCFIDLRDHNGYDSLLNTIRGMPEPRFNEHIAAIDKFMKSNEAKLFSNEFFVNTIIKGVLGC